LSAVILLALEALKDEVKTKLLKKEKNPQTTIKVAKISKIKDLSFGVSFILKGFFDTALNQIRQFGLVFKLPARRVNWRIVQ
jgi:uncharacterized membrane protein